MEKDCPASVASVIVDRAFDKPLDYAIPHAFSLNPGDRVLVRLRNQVSKGTVVALKSSSEFPNVFSIIDHLIEESLSPDLFSLSLWIAEYYCVSHRKVLQMMLPSSVRKHGKEKRQILIKRLLSQPKTAEICRQLRQDFPQQSCILDAVLQHPKGILLTELLELTKLSKSPINSLVKKGILECETIAIDRSILEEEEFFLGKPKVLNASQEMAFARIHEDLHANAFKTHLLFGITGSGKTEVYFHAMDYALSQKKHVIFLIPEISLTTQTIERLKSRFQSRIAVLHHRLSVGQRYDAWRAIQRGDVSIVIGARSSVFAPFKNLGLVIIDEEHDSSYKQTEEMPTYHARDVAIMRAKLANAVCILGSATPSLESYTNALHKKYLLSCLHMRTDSAKLPKITIIDMKQEKEKKAFIFSEALIEGIKKRAEIGEQTLLFLNRRGYHSQLLCQACQEIVKCKSCDLSLTFHRGENLLSCHFCGHSISPPPRVCPSCGSQEQMRFKGFGTEQIERALTAILPKIRTLRMDADTTKHKGSHDHLFKQFRSGKADVLIGTQMIAKGFHFPSVTLVGIIQADGALHIPDFRASETTFQLLTQVAGRSGRGALFGEVLIQTYLPEHPVIQFASKGSYEDFYAYELEARKAFAFPPYSKLIRLCFSGKEETKTKSLAESYLSKLKNFLPSSSFLFPLVPCGYTKIKGNFRFQAIIRSRKIKEIALSLKQCPFPINKDVRLLIDIDPLQTFF